MLKIMVLLIFSAIFAFANEYEDIVKNFLSYQHSKKSIENVKILKKDDFKVAYLFNLKDGGYIVVPISKKVSPVKAYSFESNFSDLPLSYKNFLINELYASLKASSTTRGINKTTLSRWNFLKDYKPTSKRDLRYKVNSFLLTSTWNQTYPYNKFFPKVNGQSTLVGCVQIALGQLMRYHKYPLKPRGVYKQDIDIYDKNGRKARTDNMVAVLNKNYNWNNMPDKFDSTTENYQEDEVAYFLRDLAIVNKAKIGILSTGASVNVDALIENFGYSRDIKRTSTSDITKTEFISTLKTQISQNLPVLLIFPGHMTVADGYKDDSSGSYVHVNMGWGGHFNDFYNLDETVNAGGYSFATTSLSMLYDIKPCNSNDGNCYVNLEKNDKLEGNVINGIFDNANDSDKYKTFLKGNVKIGGTRGYSNQAFFINIYDSNNKLVKSSDSELVLSLPADLYTIRVFLNGYSYNTNYIKYKIDITTDTLTENEKSIIEKSLAKKPVIATKLKDMIIKDDKKIFIDAFDENDGEYVVLSAIGNSNVELTFDKNILNIHPTVKKGFSDITISATSGGATTSKKFMVVINDKDMYFGKEFNIKGKFNNNSELNKHKAILDGKCSISGYRGYSNQAFFTGLMNLDDKYINTVGKVEINTDKLKQGFYLITASLKNANSSFGYDEDHSNYTLTVKCPNADENITKIATLIGINIETPKDSDGDGITDEEEKKYGTDPYNKHSYTTTINLNKGWNLISTPFTQTLSLDKLSKDIQTIRSLQNKEWSVWSQKTINSKETKLSKIEFGKGYWVKVKDDVTLTLGGVEKTSTTPLVVDGKWHLVGSYKVDDIDKFFKSNPKITIVWKYKDGKWEAKSSNPDIQDTLKQSPDIETLNYIDSTEAFFYK